ncbi:MAG: hypothetical protein NDJ89_05330 [Oligoflexia bacterium]|nr:hypothetical protein [Oligoflexia bacterium]
MRNEDPPIRHPRLFGSASVLLVAFFSASTSQATPLGASISLELPHPANLSLEARPSPEFSGSFSLGGLPAIRMNKVSLSMFTPNFRGRWHAFSGAFFIGGILGYQRLKGSTSQDFAVTSPFPATVPTSIDLTIKNLYFTPHLGWVWGMGSPGFLFGLEAGIQVPFAPASELEIQINDPSYAALLSVVQSTSEYQQAESDVETAANRVGRMVFPYVAIRLGWMF